MNPLWLPAAFWSVAAIFAAGEILLLAFSRRPIAVRAWRVGAVAFLFGTLRLLLLAVGYSWQGWWDATLLVTFFVLAAVLLPARRIWLLRVQREYLREQIETACRGLFIEYQQAPTGHLNLKTKGVTHRLRLIPLFGTFFVAVLPRTTGRDKIALLLDWLDKQYSGPIPRLRIVLKRSKS